MTQANLDEIKRLLKLLLSLPLDLELQPSYNTAPSEGVPVVTEDDGSGYKLEMMKWGVKRFIEGKWKLVTNARDDRLLAANSMWREPAQERRCVLLAEGFLEWEHAGKLRLSHYLYLRNHAAFCIAGLYGKPAMEGGPGRTVLITNEPNPLLEPFHNRMPTILAEEKAKDWFRPGPLTAELSTTIISRGAREFNRSKP